MSTRLTDPQIAAAITLLYESAVQSEKMAQDQLDLASRQLSVASSLHDLLLHEQATRLRSVI